MAAVTGHSDIPKPVKEKDRQNRNDDVHDRAGAAAVAFFNMAFFLHAKTLQEVPISISGKGQRHYRKAQNRCQAKSFRGRMRLSEGDRHGEKG